jgi:hypothetical protein
MITIHGDGNFPNAFGTTLDAAVYDPDNADDTLTWTYQDPDGNTDVNGVGPGVQLRTGPTSTFDVTTTHSLGVGASVTPADYTGTNAEAGIALATAGTATATKITVQCSDATHVTEKDILIISDAAAGTDISNGISAVIAPYSVATDFTGVGLWATDAPLIVGTPPAMPFTQTATGLQIAGTVADNLDTDIFLISGFYGATEIGPGVNQQPAGSAVDIQQGKMYRQTMTATAANVAAGALHDSMKFRLRAGTLNTATFDLQTQYINQGYRNLFPTSLGLKTPWWVSATHVGTYDNVFCPPQEARFNGIGWGGTARNYRMFIDVHDIDGYFYEGDLTFSNCVLEELDRPDVGSNGYLAAWGAGAKAFDEDYKPQASAVAQAVNGDLGFNYDVQSYSEWSGNATITRHNDILLLQGLPTGTVTDLVSTATFDSATNNQIGMYSSATNVGIVTWQIGSPVGAVGGSFNAGSAIDYTNQLLPFSNLVYYRATITVTGDPLTSNNPQLRIIFGNGYGQTAGSLVLQDGALTAAGPIDQPTVYEVWFRGPDATKADAGQPALNNLELDIQMLDGRNTAGDTWTISDVRIEAFPVAYFDN